MEDKNITEEWLFSEINNKINCAIEEIQLLRKKILLEIEKLKTSQNNLSDDDLRVYYLNQINNVLLDTSIAYLLSENLNLKDWWLKNIPDCPTNQILKRLELFHKGLNINLIYSSFNLTEDVFRQLIRKIKIRACNNGTSQFESIYICLLKELGVVYDSNLFDLFRLARNCQHNNGFYFPEKNKNEKNIMFKNVNYKFVNEKKVEYPNGFPILSILNDLIEIYINMCNSEKLKSILEIKHTNLL